MENELTKLVIDSSRFAVNGLTPPTSRKKLDFTFESIAVLDDVIDIASDFIGDMGDKKTKLMVRDYGCYMLEVVRNNFGGEYTIFEGKDLPVLIVGAPESEITISPFDKVRGKLGGDLADDLIFFMEGVKQTLETMKPGQKSLHI